MNNDLVNKALEQAKLLQKSFAEAISKSAEQAHPLLDEAVAKASDLKDTLAHGAASATEGAKPHLEGAVGHLNHFIAMGKTALETGATKVHEHLEPLADQLKKTIDSTTAAMGKKPGEAAPPHEGTPPKDSPPE